MTRVHVHSRNGNLIIAALGAIYAISAIVVLVSYVVNVWNAAAISDVALQICLVASGIAGVWFLVVALENLGIRVGKYLHHSH